MIPTLMSTAGFREWSKDLQKALTAGARRAFRAALDGGEALVRVRPLTKHHVETSFNSREGLSAVKILHLLNHKAERPGILPSEFLDRGALSALIARLNPAWEAGLAERLLEVPMPSKRNYFGLAAIFRAGSDACRKLSVYASPQEPEAAAAVAAGLGVPESALASLSLQGLSTVAVEYSAERPSAAVLKLYVDRPAPPAPSDAGFFEELRASFGADYVIVKHSLDRRGLLAELDCNYYLSRRLEAERRVSCAELRAFPSLARFRGFLGEIAPRLEERHVNSVALKDRGGVLEVYVQ